MGGDSRKERPAGNLIGDRLLSGVMPSHIGPNGSGMLKKGGGGARRRRT